MEKEQEVKIDWVNVLNETQKIFSGLKDTINNEKLNIFILGKTGVGKSTLINAVFGQNFAQTGQGKPVTQDTKSFTDNEGLTIYDSPGLELTPDKKREIEKFLEEQERKNVDEQIHLAWYCISEGSRRVEETEKELVRLLKNCKFPVLVVITKAMQDKDEKGERFSDVVQGQFGVDEVFRVRALETEDDDGETKKIIGIKELIEKSYKLLPEGQKAAFARKQTFDKKMEQEQRIKDAKALITKYSAAAAVPCANPIPFSDIVLILPIQCAMIIHISNIYGLKFDMENGKKVAAALLGVCGVGIGVRAFFGSVVKFIPGLGSIGGAVINGAVAATTTKAMGEVYLAWLNDNFENILSDMVVFDNINFGKYESLAKSILEKK